MTNLNAQLYSKELLSEWSTKDHLLLAEDKLINTYLTDTSKNVLDVGTGGGRLAFYVESLGFNDIEAFDIVPEMIEQAKKNGEVRQSNVKFSVADAVDLSGYDDNHFDYLLYLQQVLNFIPNKDDFTTALKESFRIAKKGATVIFAFLDYDTRAINKPLEKSLNLVRALRNEHSVKQQLPWVKLNNKINLKMFHKNQALTYWVKKDCMASQLESVGYTIIDVKNANQFIDENSAKRKGMLYFVCQK